MRRSRRLDWLLLATLLPLYGLMQVAPIQAQLAAGERALPLRLTVAQAAEGYPLVLSLRGVFATLNEHTERVLRLVQEQGGTVVEFNGDGMMAVFGAPDALAKKEQAAVEAARKIVDSMPGTLAVGVGVATGPAFVGSIRSTDRLIWSAVGSTTARLQSMTRDLDASIALDATTRERAGGLRVHGLRPPREPHDPRPHRGRFDVFALPLLAAA